MSGGARRGKVRYAHRGEEVGSAVLPVEVLDGHWCFSKRTASYAVSPT